jgi:hypothetical protein
MSQCTGTGTTVLAQVQLYWHSYNCTGTGTTVLAQVQMYWPRYNCSGTGTYNYTGRFKHNCIVIGTTVLSYAHRTGTGRTILVQLNSLGKLNFHRQVKTKCHVVFFRK